MMSLFQCDNCGCRENTALVPFAGIGEVWADRFDWTGKLGYSFIIIQIMTFI